MTHEESIERRLARIESRLVQLMIFLGADPYERAYDNLASAKHTRPAKADSQSQPQTKGEQKPGSTNRSRICGLFTRPLFQKAHGASTR